MYNKSWFGLSSADVGQDGFPTRMNRGLWCHKKSNIKISSSNMNERSKIDSAVWCSWILDIVHHFIRNFPKIGILPLNVPFSHHYYLESSKSLLSSNRKTASKIKKSSNCTLWQPIRRKRMLNIMLWLEKLGWLQPKLILGAIMLSSQNAQYLTVQLLKKKNWI